MKQTCTWTRLTIATIDFNHLRSGVECQIKCSSDLPNWQHQALSLFYILALIFFVQIMCLDNLVNLFYYIIIRMRMGHCSNYILDTVRKKNYWDFMVTNTNQLLWIHGTGVVSWRSLQFPRWKIVCNLTVARHHKNVVHKIHDDDDWLDSIL